MSEISSRRARHYPGIVASCVAVSEFIRLPFATRVIVGFIGYVRDSGAVAASGVYFRTMLIASFSVARTGNCCTLTCIPEDSRQLLDHRVVLMRAGFGCFVDVEPSGLQSAPKSTPVTDLGSGSSNSYPLL